MKLTVWLCCLSLLGLSPTGLAAEDLLDLTPRDPATNFNPASQSGHDLAEGLAIGGVGLALAAAATMVGGMVWQPIAQRRADQAWPAAADQFGDPVARASALKVFEEADREAKLASFITSSAFDIAVLAILGAEVSQHVARSIRLIDPEPPRGPPLVELPYTVPADSIPLPITSPNP